MPTKRKYDTGKVDKTWFEERLKERGISLCELGRRLAVDVWSIYHTFSGKREMRLIEAEYIAEILNVSLIEVIRHAGIRVAEFHVPLAGHIDGEGVVHLTAKSSEPPVGETVAPADFSLEGLALLCIAESGPLTPLNGWVFFTGRPATRIGSDLLGRLVIAKPTKASLRLCRLARESSMTYAVAPALGGHPLCVGKVDWAAPVRWIRP
ncbi:MAG TPA: helix-turn-helix transcriptional regulator [Burkholderiaceae bacterium]|nr:helix-turn-helix transcriptional regulator [Burkholderiaceae bacterium]